MPAFFFRPSPVSSLSAAASLPVSVILRGLSPWPPHLSRPSQPWPTLRSQDSQRPPPAVCSPMESACRESTWIRRLSDRPGPFSFPASLSRGRPRRPRAPRPRGAQLLDGKVVRPRWGSSSSPSLTSDRTFLRRDAPLGFGSSSSLSGTSQCLPLSATPRSSPGSWAGSGCSR